MENSKTRIYAICLFVWLSHFLITSANGQESLKAILEGANSPRMNELTAHDRAKFKSFDFKNFIPSSKDFSGFEVIASYDKDGQIIDLRFGPTATRNYYDLTVITFGNFILFDSFKMDSAIWGYGGSTGEKLVLDCRHKKMVCIDPNGNALVLLDSILRPMAEVRFDIEKELATKIIYRLAKDGVDVTEFKLPSTITKRLLFSVPFFEVVKILEDTKEVPPFKSYKLKSTFNPYDLLENLRIPRSD